MEGVAARRETSSATSRVWATSSDSTRSRNCCCSDSVTSAPASSSVTVAMPNAARNSRVRSLISSWRRGAGGPR